MRAVGPSSARLSWAIAATLLVGACKLRPGDRVAESSVRVLSGVAGLDTKALEQTFRETLDSHLPRRLPDFDWARPTEIGERWKLEATLELSESQRPIPSDGGVLPKDQVFRGARTKLRLSLLGAESGRAGRREWLAEAVAARNLPVFDGFQVVIAEGVEAALGQIAVERELGSAKKERILEVLKSPDAAFRARAVDAIRERGEKDFVPPLIERLADESEDPLVVVKTIGALVALRDPRAVPVLIDSARRRSPIYLTQIIFGVAEIGGKEAEAYLFTVASGHAEPEVRKNAEDALEELARRKDKSSSMEGTP